MADGPLAKKLLIKPGQRAVILNPPPGYMENLSPLPDGVKLAEKPDGLFDFVQLFVKDSEELRRYAPLALAAIKRDAILWVSYPKQSSKVKTDLTRDRGWEPLQEAGFVGVAMVSIDETWSAFRLRPVDHVGKKKK